MKTERIGQFVFDELPATVAIHKGLLIHPMSLHYSKQHNAVIVYTILNVKKEEWKVARAIADLAKELDAKEILCIDGATTDEAEQIFAFGNPQLTALGAKPMQESVIMGVAGALLLTTSNTNCVFASAQQDLPDSKAAAEVVKFLDKYMGLEVDYHPLLEQAQKFEEKLKTIMQKSQEAQEMSDKKKLSYLG